MNTICVVQGGKFLLGIDAAHILARTAWAEIESQRKKDEKVFHLAALLSQQPGGVVPPGAVCLELEGGNEHFLLLADQIVDEAEVINPPGPLPPACPRLAARLCPQVTVWGDTPVLLLDPAQVIPVAAELGEGIGLLAEEPDSVEEALFVGPPEPEEEDDPFFPEDKPVPVFFAPEEDAAEPEDEGPLAFLMNDEEDEPVEDGLCACSDVDAEDDGQPLEASSAMFREDSPTEEELGLFSGEDNTECLAATTEPGEADPCACPVDVNADAEECPSVAIPTKPPKKESSTIDEETFNQVMRWTINRFKQSRAGEELRLGTDQLPPDLADMVEEKGLSRSIIQYLMDQIVLRCKETESAGRRLPGEHHVR